MSAFFLRILVWTLSSMSAVVHQEGADRDVDGQRGQLPGQDHAHRVCGDHRLRLPGLPAQSEGDQPGGEPVCQGLSVRLAVCLDVYLSLCLSSCLPVDMSV